MKLSRFMDDAYQHKVRNRKLETRRGDLVLGLEDLADKVGDRPTRAEVEKLAPIDVTLLQRLVSQKPKGKRNSAIWGILTAIAADRSAVPFRLEAGDYAGAELSRGTLILEQGGDHVGEKMSGGKIMVLKGCGDYLGQEMTGGGILAQSCRDYAFRNMRGGWGVVRGDAGNYAGLGNQLGKILIRGSSGERTGWMMRGGRITILNDCGDYLGILISGGEIVVFGNAGRRAGWRMKGGTICASRFGEECGAETVGGTILRRDP